MPLPVSIRIAEQSLKAKGFRQAKRNHRMFFFWVKGKKTAIFTYTSHGSKSEDACLYLMKKELRLDANRQAYDFLTCPMTGEDYI